MMHNAYPKEVHLLGLPFFLVAIYDDCTVTLLFTDFNFRGNVLCHSHLIFNTSDENVAVVT